MKDILFCQRLGVPNPRAAARIPRALPKPATPRFTRVPCVLWIAVVLAVCLAQLPRPASAEPADETTANPSAPTSGTSAGTPIESAFRQALIEEEANQNLDAARLCGVREIVAFSLGAIIGDIKRFANSAKLVKYIGLNPAFDHSGEGQWKGGIGGHGRKDLRALLIESAQSIMRSPDHPQAKWGRHLMASKGSANLAVAAVARKLTVAIWYLMMGKWSALEEVDSRLDAKLGKIIANVGPPGLKALDKTRKQLKEESRQTIRTGRIYILHPLKKPDPQPEPDPLPHQKPDRCQHCGAPKALLTKKTNKTAGAQTSSQSQPSNQPLRPKTSAPQGHNP